MVLTEAVRLRGLFTKLKGNEQQRFVMNLIKTKSEYIQQMVRGLYYVIQHDQDDNLAITCNGIIAEIIQSRPTSTDINGPLS